MKGYVLIFSKPLLLAMDWTPLAPQPVGNQGPGIQVSKESVSSVNQTRTQGSVDLNVSSQSEHQTFNTEENKEVR